MNHHVELVCPDHDLLSAEEEVKLSLSIHAYQGLVETLRESVDEASTNPDWESLLTDDDRKRLAAKRRLWKRSRDRLAACNMKLVKKFALAMYNTDRVFDAELRYSAGLEGLMRAVDKYDATKINPRNNRPYRFSTYASWWIRQAITRDRARHGSAITIAFHAYEKTAKWNRLSEQGDPTYEEAYEIWGDDPYKKISMVQNARFPKSLNYFVGDDETIELQEMVADRNNSAALSATMDEFLTLASQILNKQERAVFSGMFLRCQPNGDRWKNTTLAPVMGFTPQRVQQIKTKAIRKLRKAASEGKLGAITEGIY